MPILIVMGPGGLHTSVNSQPPRRRDEATRSAPQAKKVFHRQPDEPERANDRVQGRATTCKNWSACIGKDIFDFVFGQQPKAFARVDRGLCSKRGTLSKNDLAKDGRVCAASFLDRLKERSEARPHEEKSDPPRF